MITYSGQNWDEGRATTWPGVFAPLYYQADEHLPRLPGSIWDTDGRQYNDCVHVKAKSPGKGIPALPTFVDRRGNSLPQVYCEPCPTWGSNGSAVTPLNTNWIATPSGTVIVNITPVWYRMMRVDYLNIRFRIVYPVKYGARWQGIKGELRYYADRHWENRGSSFDSRIMQVFRENPPVIPDLGRPVRAPLSLLRDLAEVAFDDSFVRNPPYNCNDNLFSDNSAVSEDPPTLAELSSGFLFGEENLPTAGHPVRYGRSNFWLEYAKQHAFLDACQSMPRLSDNSIQNCQEIFEILLSVVRRDIKLPKRFGDLWLGYRYQYNTSKMDLEEAISFVDRYIDLGGLANPIESRGVHRFTVGDVEVTCRCQIECVPRQILNLKNAFKNLSVAWQLASQYGFAPDLYYLWDSTPFSFIVDWFLPIGNILAAEDASFLYTGTNYDFRKIEYSLSYEKNFGLYPYQYYSRWYESGSPPRLNAWYWLEPNPPASVKQIAFRTLDAVSLFIGG